MSEKVVISKTARMCPIVFTFIEEWAKNLSAENFDRLIVPRVDRIQNSYVVDEKVQASRVFLILDWLVRTSTPNWLEQARMDESARKLRELPELSNISQLTPAQAFLELALLRVTPLEMANRILSETILLFDPPQGWSPSIVENSQRLAASSGVLAALYTVVKLQRPAFSLVASRAAAVSFNGAAVLLSSGAAPKEDSTIIGKELGIHKSAVDLLDKLLDFSGWITIDGPDKKP